MHENIMEMPLGVVVGSCRLAKGDVLMDLTRIKHGSMTTFVEQVWRRRATGLQRVAMRRTDEFPSDTIADRFISAWLVGITQNRFYRVLKMDDAFDGGEQQ